MSEDPIYLRTALDALKRKNNVANETMKQLAQEVQRLQEIIMKQELQMKNIFKGNIKKAKIIQSAVNIANSISNEYLKEINELREKVKCLSQ